MSEDPQDTRRDKPWQKDKFIPPPMDPYATYQTPYERRQTPEPNPFIEFRRFADKQFSDIFSGLQTFANFPKMFGVEDGMKDLREQLEKDMKEMIALQKARNDVVDVLRRSERDSNKSDNPFLATGPPASTSSLSTGHRFAEATRPESSPKFGTDNPQKQFIAAGDGGKEWLVDPSTGLVVSRGSDASMSAGKEQQDDRGTRWKRGFRNCPGLKKYRGETELDMYESYEDLQQPRQSARLSSNDKPSWSSWLSAYGYDGLQQSRKGSESEMGAPSRQREDSSACKCDVRTYRVGQTRRMDPLKNDHEFMPWFVLSPYSPIFLANPDTLRSGSVTMHNGCEGGCDRPIDLRSFNNPQIDIDQHAEFRTRLSGKVPWIDAFEDLLSLERTGKMPSRNPDNTGRPRYMTDSWLHDTVQKGLLGPKWSLQDGNVMRDSRGDPRRRNRTERNLERQQIEESYRRTMIDPLVMAMQEEVDADIAEARKAKSTKDESHNEFQALQKEYEQYKTQSQQLITADAKSVALSEQEKAKVEQPQPKNLDTQTDPAKAQQKLTQPTKPKMSMISTLTTMTTRTLPDGSIETKRVLKKRFADGNEESEESTEVIYPQISKFKAGGDATKQQEKKQGWFWT